MNISNTSTAMGDSDHTVSRRSKGLCKTLASTGTNSPTTRINLQHANATADPTTTTIKEKVTKVEKEKRNLILSPLLFHVLFLKK